MNFDEAFLRINGRKPNDTETKEALALADVLKQADLDPMLLLVMVDAKAKAEREKFVVDMREIAKETIATIRKDLPTSPGELDRLSKAPKAGQRDILLNIGILLAVAAAVIFLFWMSWQMGYRAGYEAILTTPVFQK